MVSLLTQPDGSAYKYSYDAAHRLTQITDKAGDAIDYTYDATSNVTAVNIYDPSKTLTRTHSYTYVAGNRLASDTGATAAEKTTYVYDNEGNLLTRSDPLNHASTYTYDALNRRASFLDSLNGKTTYTYDENNDLAAGNRPARARDNLHLRWPRRPDQREEPRHGGKPCAPLTPPATCSPRRTPEPRWAPTPMTPSTGPQDHLDRRRDRDLRV
jgi:YD repeat-containing protein